MAIISFKTSCRICNYIRWKDIKGWTNGDDDDIDHNHIARPKGTAGFEY